MRRKIGTLLTVLALAACTSTSGKGSTTGSAAPSSPTSSAPASTASTTATSSSPASTTAAPRPTPAAQSFPLNGLRVADLSFVGDQGWALGTVGCTTGSGLCPALAHSTDGGRHWRSLSTPPAPVDVPELDTTPCSGSCVTHVRFATDRIGYLFGPTTLFTTADGGHTWRRQPGGADALESLDGNVIRVVDAGGCPPGCRYSVRTAAIGGTAWRDVALPGSQGGGDSVQLVRTGRLSALEVYGNPAGGAPARAVLFTSRDDGASWTRRGEPCPQGSGVSGEVDSRLLSSAPDGSITILCANRGGGTQFVITSTDGGASFSAGARTALGGAGVGALGAASAGTVLVSSDQTYRSTDGGRRFAKPAGDPGQLSWLGFASATVGHAISLDRRTIWTTADAGRTWDPATLH